MVRLVEALQCPHGSGATSGGMVNTRSRAPRRGPREFIAVHPGAVVRRQGVRAPVLLGRGDGGLNRAAPPRRFYDRAGERARSRGAALDVSRRTGPPTRSSASGSGRVRGAGRGHPARERERGDARARPINLRSPRPPRASWTSKRAAVSAAPSAAGPSHRTAYCHGTSIRRRPPGRMPLTPSERPRITSPEPTTKP